MTDAETNRLTTAIAAGDPAALARLYDDWFDRLHRDARRLTGRDEAFCLDLLQDVFLRVIRGLPRLESEAALAAWFATTLRRAAIDRLRAEHRRAARERRPRDGGLERKAECDRVAENDERRAWLAGLLAELDPGERELLRLRHELRWTLGRIGDALGLSPGAVDGRLTRILERLRRRAGELRGDGPRP